MSETQLRLQASPTKEFFIDMLVRDVKLERAIADLVDNCVDGANRLRPNGDFNGLYSRMELAPKHFRIIDNCGGIPLAHARDYAFRFGRPVDAPAPGKRSIGLFGVGMKRAFFKLGSHFRVESVSEHSRLILDVNVDEWKGNPDDWTFEPEQARDSLELIPEVDRGTRIEVTDLHDAVAQDFTSENFIRRFTLDLADDHQDAILRGMQLTVNGVPLTAAPSAILQSTDLKPAHVHLVFDEQSTEPIFVNLYAGVGPRAKGQPSDAGWNVYCNQRLVLRANRGPETGWGDREQVIIPAYHGQFAQFRGYAYFECEDAGKLPWNTTKSSIDTDSPLYKAARLEMIKLMRPVIDFLNQLDREVEAERQTGAPTPLNDAVESAEAVPLASVAVAPRFVAPVVKGPRAKPATRRIQYSKPTEQVEKAMERLNVSTITAVGEKTFEYYYRLECQD